MSRFLDQLHSETPIVADGGLGALLAQRHPRLRIPEEANSVEPEAVIGLHVEFIQAGADLIETNTFGANRSKLRAQRLDHQLERLLSQGVKLAREAREITGKPVFIAGAIGPIGHAEGPRPQGNPLELFQEQADLLAGRGVDLILLETFYDLDELLTAIHAVRNAAALPMVAQLTFDDEGETLAGTSPEQAIDRIAQEGLAAVGANCGLGPQATLDALTAMAQPARAAGLPLTAQPNVGLPGRAIDGRLLYPNATPEYFADFATHARDLGARLVGGCCGTQPTHIHAIHQAMLDEPQSRPRQPLLIPEPSRSPPAPPHAEPEPTLLERMLRNGEWVVSVELDPPKGSNLNHLLAACEQLRDSGLVHAVDLNDNPMARARMNALATAGILQAHTGIETIPHLTPRDATIMGLQSQLLAAHATGVRNLLLVTGDPPHVGDYPGTTGVYELDAIGLTDLVTRLNHGADYAGKTIDQPTSFYAGVAVNPTAQDLDQELDRYHQKIQAGARFAMTQALFDTSQLDRFLDKLSGSSPIPMLIGIWPLTSHQLAQRLHNEVPGITVPQQIRDQLAHAGNNAHRVGLRVARRFYDEVRQRAAGVYIIPTFKRPLTALDLLC